MLAWFACLSGRARSMFCAFHCLVGLTCGCPVGLSVGWLGTVSHPARKLTNIMFMFKTITGVTTASFETIRKHHPHNTSKVRLRLLYARESSTTTSKSLTQHVKFQERANTYITSRHQQQLPCRDFIHFNAMNNYMLIRFLRIKFCQSSDCFRRPQICLNSKSCEVAETF